MIPRYKDNTHLHLMYLELILSDLGQKFPTLTLKISILN
jgi:hypothetical protein